MEIALAVERDVGRDDYGKVQVIEGKMCIHMLISGVFDDFEA